MQNTHTHKQKNMRFIIDVFTVGPKSAHLQTDAFANLVEQVRLLIAVRLIGLQNVHFLRMIDAAQTAQTIHFALLVAIDFQSESLHVVLRVCPRVAAVSVSEAPSGVRWDRADATSEWWLWPNT